MKKLSVLLCVMLLLTACGRSKDTTVPDVDLEDFFESLTKELSETHPDWQIIENHPYRIICF